MSRGRTRVRVALLLADKRMIEADGLWKKGKNSLATATANEAMNKLEYADYLSDPKDGQLRKQIILAGFAYREILTRSDKIEGIKSQNWANLIKRVDDWNTQQKI